MSIRTILITGGIGAGKSVVSRVLRLRGITVYATDLAARRIMDSDPELAPALTGRWGESVFSADGTLDRRFIASRIFGDDEERLWLNSLVHGAVRDDICALIDTLPDGSLIGVECAIPVTSRIVDFADRVWLVDAPEQTRIERVCRRNATDPDSVRARIASQQSEYDALPAEITSRILNDGRHSLLSQIDDLLTKL